MDLQTLRDGTIPNITHGQLVELLSEDRDFGNVATLFDGKGNFLQAVDAETVARSTDIEGWQDSYVALSGGNVENGEPRVAFVLIWRTRASGRSKFCNIVIPRRQVAATLASYLADDDSWRSVGSWINLPA